MKRGLKAPNSSAAASWHPSVALITPMKRGLKDKSQAPLFSVVDRCTNYPDEKGTERPAAEAVRGGLEQLH